MELNDKQNKFIVEYLKDYNSTKAAIRAGYSEKGAHVAGNRLLSNIKIAKGIKDGEKEQGLAAHISKTKVLQNLLEIADNMTSQKNKDKSNCSAQAIKCYEIINKMLGYYESMEEGDTKIVAIQVNVKTNNKDG